MRINPQDHREQLQRLRRSGALPPAPVWLPYLALTRGREPDAVLIERRDEAGVVTIVLHALLGWRLLRIIGSGPDGWDDPLGGGQDPFSVVTESWPLAGAKVSVLEATTIRDDTTAGYAYTPQLSLDCAGEHVSVPYFGVDAPATSPEALDEFTAALLSALAG